MANLIDLKGISPKISKSAWVADNATISGDVSVGEGSSIWFQVVIRGDLCFQIQQSILPLVNTGRHGQPRLHVGSRRLRILNVQVCQENFVV